MPECQNCHIEIPKGKFCSKKCIGHFIGTNYGFAINKKQPIRTYNAVITMGFQGLTIHEISAATRTPESTIYYIFKKWQKQNNGVKIPFANYRAIRKKIRQQEKKIEKQQLQMQNA